MSDISLNEQADHDKVGNLVLQFVDHYGDMYVDKYGPFAGDDLVFIDAAQYLSLIHISILLGQKHRAGSQTLKNPGNIRSCLLYTSERIEYYNPALPFRKR